MKLKIIFFLFSFLFLFSFSKAQTITINGYISDSTSGEKLIGAVIFDNISKEGTTTNNYGFFSLTLKNDKAEVITSYLGYGGKLTTVQGSGVHTINIEMNRTGLLKEVNVKANRNPIQQQSQMSAINIPIEQIKKVPALMGETDVLKVLQLLPGVSKAAKAVAEFM